ncbi:cytochrome o ubiquinol oxidase subunit IV [Notoacmeibacter ruber]|uniref:Cytochrome bo(3) ubiquinol oxidase subunit 4 n=1 Tax=Notoacmeibacter ruber TaxID=2670375 RepID=A0A3L7JCJ7_9HYPH|nr:cytochrome C oxidase subunit IV family protein [Notoacmeibacter ruber]RLQ88386.1 cytochrome-c oxidase [Notoacmeibacter ruber]
MKGSPSEEAQKIQERGNAAPKKLREEELATYLKGLAFAAVLTIAAFAVIMADLLEGWAARLTVYGLGLIQIGVHLYYFLHLDFKGSRREDLLLVLFTTLLAILMVGGTLWIVLGMNARMMPAGMMGGTTSISGGM